MPFSAKSVANEFLDLANASGKTISPMKLQKLVYFAHGWFLALVGQPLIDERIQAWQFGPVIPDLYHEFKGFGNGAISSFASDIRWTPELKIHNPRLQDCDGNEDVSSARELIEKTWNVYKDYSAVQLSNATHVDGSPWKETYSPGTRNRVIDDALITEYFKKLASHGQSKR